MKIQTTLALICAVVLVTTTTAQAEEAVYVRALGSLAMLSDTDLDSATLGAGDAEFDTGFGAGASIGYDFGRWRIEGELLYRTNDIDGVSGTAFDGVDDGDFSSLGLGLNAFYEFNLLKNPRINTYAGVGVVWFEEIDIDFESPASELSYSGDDTALQLMFGSRYQLSEKFELYAEIRRLFASSIELEGEGSALGEIEADYDRTEFILGVGYRF